MEGSALQERITRNETAWKNMGGYETSSGCPCWDKTPYPCIPKHTLGYNPNFWALFCLCLCQKSDLDVLKEGKDAPPS